MEIIDKFISLNRLLSTRNSEWSVIRDKIDKSFYRYRDLSRSEIIGTEVRLFIQLIGSFNGLEHAHCLYYRFDIIENTINIHIRKSLNGDIIYNHGDFSILELSKIDLDELNDMLLNKMYDYVTDLIAEPRNRKINIITDDN